MSPDTRPDPLATLLGDAIRHIDALGTLNAALRIGRRTPERALDTLDQTQDIVHRLTDHLAGVTLTASEPQPDTALCPATQQTETWGLMWCGLFAGHEPRDHAWFSEDQHPLRSTPAAPDPVADVLLVRERDQPQPDAGSRIGPCTSEDGEHDWQPGPAWCARCQPQPDAVLREAAQAVVEAWDSGHGEPSGSTYLALPTEAEMDALRLALAMDGVLPRMAFVKYGQFYNDDPDFDIEAYYLRAAEAIIEDHPDLFAGVTLTQPQPARCGICDAPESDLYHGPEPCILCPHASPHHPFTLTQPQPDAGLRDDLRGLLHEISGDLDARADSGDDISRDLGDRLRAALRSTPAAPDPVADVLLVREQDFRSTPAAPQPDTALRECKCSPLDGHDKHCEAGLDVAVLSDAMRYGYAWTAVPFPDQWPAVARAVAAEYRRHMAALRSTPAAQTLDRVKLARAVGAAADLMAVIEDGAIDGYYGDWADLIADAYEAAGYPGWCGEPRPHSPHQRSDEEACPGVPETPTKDASHD